MTVIEHFTKLNQMLKKFKWILKQKLIGFQNAVLCQEDVLFCFLSFFKHKKCSKFKCKFPFSSRNNIVENKNERKIILLYKHERKLRKVIIFFFCKEIFKLYFFFCVLKVIYIYIYSK